MFMKCLGLLFVRCWMGFQFLAAKLVLDLSDELPCGDAIKNQQSC